MGLWRCCFLGAGADAGGASVREDGGDVSPAAADAAARRRASLTIGIVHGMSAPSGILAVLPAIVLSDATKSVAYLLVRPYRSTLCCST